MYHSASQVTSNYILTISCIQGAGRVAQQGVSSNQRGCICDMTDSRVHTQMRGNWTSPRSGLTSALHRVRVEITQRKTLCHFAQQGQQGASLKDEWQMFSQQPPSCPIANNGRTVAQFCGGICVSLGKINDERTHKQINHCVLIIIVREKYQHFCGCDFVLHKQKLMKLWGYSQSTCSLFSKFLLIPYKIKSKFKVFKVRRSWTSNLETSDILGLVHFI